MVLSLAGLFVKAYIIDDWPVIYYPSRPEPDFLTPISVSLLLDTRLAFIESAR